MKGDAGTGLHELVRDAVRAEVGGMFEELRRFFDRRIAELSTEILATLETVDVYETHFSDQLQQMHGEISRVMALPSDATRNSGLELEGVIETTDAAANRIMGAAETIRAAVEAGGENALILDQVNEIFEACSFQDLTGQRIRRALEHLQMVEGTISEMVEQSGAPAVERARPVPIRATAEITGKGADLSQDEIDKLFA
jgi:chemotaxis regulatin CheY-phosphate phosphatase CheZ